MNRALAASIAFASIVASGSPVRAVPPARNPGIPPEVQQMFETEPLGLMPSDWARYTGSGGGCLNYDADWRVTAVAIPWGGTTRALSATEDSGLPGVNLSWCEYRGTTLQIVDGIIPPTARYYVETLLHTKGLAQPGAEQEHTLQPYFVDGFTYVEIMLLSYDEGLSWEVAVFQFHDGSWWKPFSWPLAVSGWNWWGRVGMEIDRATGNAWFYYNGQIIGGPVFFDAINTSDTVRTNVRATNNLLDADDFRIYILDSGTTFADVPAHHWAYAYIEAIYREGITTGCVTSPLQYCPASSVTRSQMAAFICRAAGQAWYDSGGATFVDVPRGSDGQYATPPYSGGLDADGTRWGYGLIERVADPASWGGVPVTHGCGSGYYCFSSVTTRGQMAAFLCRANGKTWLDPGVASFSDVPRGVNGMWDGGGSGGIDADGTHIFYGWVERLADAPSWGGTPVTSGCGADTYCPANPCRRDQMAVFLCRAFGIPY